MINDILNTFEIDFKKAIIDNYQLKEGLYVRVGEKIEFFIYKRGKKENPQEIGLKDLEGNIRANEYRWFAIRDYISNYLNSNKAIDPPKKKIHNNNYLTLFVKAKEFNKENRDYFCQKLYDNLKDFSLFKRKEEKEVIDSFKNYIFSDFRQKDVENKKQKFLEIFDEILEKKENIKDGEYIRVFFDEELEVYENEAKIYYALKIYNKIKTVIKIDNEIFGLSDFNMGLNAKKPYLEHKTRGFKLPFMVKKDEIFKIKELFDFLKYQRNLIDDFKPSNFKSGIFLLKHSSNDQAEITDFDILVKSTRLNPKFILRDFLETKEDEVIEDSYILFKRIDEIFYNGNLENNLFGDVYSKLPNTLINLIYLTRDAMKSLKKGEIKPLFKINKKFANDFITYHLRQNRKFRAKEALNLKLSIFMYEGEKMDIKATLGNIENKIFNLESLDSDEFFVLSGQIIYFLLSKSKKSEKNADMIEPFLRAGKVKKLKQEIETLFFTYKHSIPLNFTKFNNALALIESFEEQERVKKDKLLVGILSDNIFYKVKND